MSAAQLHAVPVGSSPARPSVTLGFLKVLEGLERKGVEVSFFVHEATGGFSNPAQDKPTKGVISFHETALGAFLQAAKWAFPARTDDLQRAMKELEGAGKPPSLNEAVQAFLVVLNRPPITGSFAANSTTA